MADVVKSEVMHDHTVPVLLLELVQNVPRNVVIDLSKILEA